MENYAHLFRTKRSSHGTEGILSIGSFSCFSLELPWKENRPNVSCIPQGKYDVQIRMSPKFGKVYHVTEVPGRSHILIHAGNLAGDTEQNLKTHVQGCILLGKYRGILRNQRAVLCSRPTVRSFINYLESTSFKLEIHEAL